MLLFLSLFACGKKDPEIAKPLQVEDLGSGAMRLGTVVFEGVEIQETAQEESLEKVETKAKEEQNGDGKEEETLEQIQEIEELLRVYQEFIQYEYGDDDEKNADYLVKDKMKVFHQLTGSAYDIVVAERNYYEVSAGIYVAGASELRYAEMWNRYPAPEYLDHNSTVLFGERVRDTVAHLGEEGKDKLERIISHYFRSMVSGQYTVAALEELQWRFPNDYPKPIPDKDGSALSVYYQYEKFQDEPMIDLPSKWDGTDFQQMEWISRVEDAKTLMTDIRAVCEKMPEKYIFLGDKVATICQLEEYINTELLIYRYPVPTLTPNMQKTQTILEKEIEARAADLQNWGSSEYELFWKKEAQKLLREYQFEKMKAMKKFSRSGKLISVDWSTWQFQEPEEMDKPTADILDGHLLQLERISRIMNYDIKDMKWDDRGMVLRMMYVEIPKQLQELEFSIQAVLFAFPEASHVRSRLMVSLVESYSYYLYYLPKLQTEDSKKHIEAIIAMHKPFVLGLTEIVQKQEIDEQLKARVDESVKRLGKNVLQAE